LNFFSFFFEIFLARAYSNAILSAMESVSQFDGVPREELIKMVIDFRAASMESSRQLKWLKRQLEWFKRQLFGRKSERLVDACPDQLELPLDIPEPAPSEPDVVIVPEHVKRKPDKGKGEFTLTLPEDLPVEEIIHEPPEARRVCPKTGKAMVEIGSEVVDKLACRKNHYYLKRNIYKKYAVPGEPLSGVVQAPAPTCILNGSKFDVSFMADLVVEKYAFHQPLNRVQEGMAGFGITVSRQTLSTILMKLGESVIPLYDLMKRKAFEGGVLFTDDTPVKLIVKGARKAKTGRMWIYLAGKPNAPPYHVYDFTKDWRHEHPIEFLKEFEGVFHADAYEAYEKIDKNRNDVSWAACWAHARREFEKALGSGDSAFCLGVLRLMRRLFLYERVAWSRGAEERLSIREEKEAPIVDELMTLLRDELNSPTLLPSSPRFKAINYMLSRRENFKVYLSDSDVRMDNNPAERALRKVCLGKKNWMFVGSAKAGKSAAALFSLVQTCRAMKINPREYLEDLFTRLLDHPAKRLEEFLPDKWALAQKELSQESDQMPCR